MFIVQKLTTFNTKGTFKMDSMRKYKLVFLSLFLSLQSKEIIIFQNTYKLIQ